MQNSGLLHRVVWVLLVLSASAAGASWWLYVQQRRENARIVDNLDRATEVKSRLADVNDVLARMGTELDEMADRLSRSGHGEDVPPTGETELTLAALTAHARMLTQRNESLEQQLKDAQEQFAKADKARQDLSAKLNQANVDLVHVNRDLLADLKKKQDESAARADEITRTKKSLAEANAAVTNLTKTKTDLLDRIKTLTEAESQAKAETARLQELLDAGAKDLAASRKKAQDLAKDLAAARKRADDAEKKTDAAQKKAADSDQKLAALMQQIEDLKKRIKELEALVEKLKQTPPATPPTPPAP